MNGIKIGINALNEAIEELNIISFSGIYDFSQVCFLVNNGSLKLIRTGEGIRIITNEVLIKSNSNFSLTMNYFELKNIVDSLVIKKGVIDFFFDNSLVNVSIDGFTASYKIHYEINNYIDEFKNDIPLIKINAQSFYEALEKSASSIDDYRDNLKGVLLQFGDSGFYLVSSNGHIASLNKFNDIFYPFNKNIKVFIGSEALESILHFFNHNSQFSISAIFEQNNIYLQSNGGARIEVVLDNNNFPDWENIILNKINNNNSIKIEKSKLVTFCRIAKDFNGRYGVVIEVKNDELQLTYEGNDFKFHEAFKIEQQTELMLKMKVSLDYFLNALLSINSTVIKLSIGDSLVLSETSESMQYQRVVMSMKI